jgi:chemosensory pili system protein ChpA (sensor histidine kinase/response regulator)
MVKTYGHLAIADLGNKSEVAAVVEAHRMVKAYRVKIEKKRKEIKAPALAFGKAVDKEGKRLMALIEPLETHLDAEREKLRAAERAAAEAEKKAEAEKLQGRIDAMNAVNGPVNLDMLANITDQSFELELRAAKEAEAERVAEQHRIEKEREAAAEAEQVERRAAMERENAARIEREKLAEENRVQQKELQRLKQAESQRVAAERPAIVADAIVTAGKAIAGDSREMSEPLLDDDANHAGRLRAMVDPFQETWDLSPNDVAAIQWALDRIAELEATA